MPVRPAITRAKSLLTVGAVATGLLGSTGALADDKAACLDASLQAQSLRNAHKLLEARDQLRICAANKCPRVVQTDCATWLVEVETALPTVVVSAKSGAGADLVDVKVSVDGKPLASRLDGQAMPMNPGPRAFHFEGADGTALDQQIVVREGERNQAVAVVIGPVPAPSPAPVDHPAEAEPSSPWKTVGWVLGGVGVAGLGVGTAFGIVAATSKGSDCPTASTCKSGSISGLKSDALVSDVGLIAGGLLFAGGVALVLFAPSGSHEAGPAAGTVRLTPVVTPSGGAVLVGTGW